MLIGPKGPKGAATGVIEVISGWMHNFQRAKEALRSPNIENEDGGAVIKVYGLMALESGIRGRYKSQEGGLASETNFIVM